MAEEKKAFLLYYDWESLFDSLDSNEEAGELIKALFAFAKRGEITEFSGALKMAFIFMSQQLARDSEKWGDIREKRREAVNKRWEKQKNTNEYKSIQKIQMNTNDTVTVTGTVNVTDTVLKENKKEKLSELDKIISDYSDNQELQQALKDFLKFRKAIKAPMTDKALQLSINKLDKLGRNDIEKIAIINQSIERGWKGLFELKEPVSEPTTNIDEYKAVIGKFLY